MDQACAKEEIHADLCKNISGFVHGVTKQATFCRYCAYTRKELYSGQMHTEQVPSCLNT